MLVSFFVAGMPGTKGSVRAFVVKSKATGKARAVITNDSKKAAPWAALVTAAAREAMRGEPPTREPVRVEIAFHLPRPKSHFRANGQLRPDAPTMVAKRPDGDKLVRCLWDALTGVVFVDDAQIVMWPGEKLYSNRTGAAVTISSLPPLLLP